MSYQELRHHIESLSSTGHDKGGDAHLLGDVARAFSDYEGLPDPADLDVVLGRLRKGPPHLFTVVPTGNPFFPPGTAPLHYNPALAELNAIDRTLQGWTGAAADAFRRQVLDRFQLVARNQFEAATVIVAVLEAERLLWEQVRINIDQLAERAVAALGIVDEWCHPRREWVIHFTAYEAVTNLLRDRLPDIGLVQLGSILQPIGRLRSDRPEMWISGSTANAVLASTHGAVRECTRYLVDVEQTLARTMEDLRGQLRGAAADFELEHTVLADVTAADATSVMTTDG